MNWPEIKERIENEWIISSFPFFFFLFLSHSRRPSFYFFYSFRRLVWEKRKDKKKGLTVNPRSGDLGSSLFELFLEPRSLTVNISSLILGIYFLSPHLLFIIVWKMRRWRENKYARNRMNAQHSMLRALPRIYFFLYFLVTNNWMGIQSFGPRSDCWWTTRKY